MALLNCPECNGKVSDKAEICPHCGYPVNKIKANNLSYADKKYTIINGIKYDVTDIVNIILSPNFKLGTPNSEYVNNKIRNNFNIAPIKFLKPVMDLKDAPKEINCKTLTEFKQEQQHIQASQPCCPHCHSTNIKAISGTKKVASIIGFGILSNNIGKTYECLNCKYKW